MNEKLKRSGTCQGIQQKAGEVENGEIRLKSTRKNKKCEESGMELEDVSRSVNELGGRTKH